MAEQQINPRMNHVAMSVPAEWLDAARRDEIVDFYNEVFGWTRASMERSNDPLVLQTQEWGDFIFIYPSKDGDYMRTPALDHYGFRVFTMDELDTVLDRAKKRAVDDDRVTIIDKKAERFTTTTLTNCYIGFLLPLMVELQHYTMHEPAPEPSA